MLLGPPVGVQVDFTDNELTISADIFSQIGENEHRKHVGEFIVFKISKKALNKLMSSEMTLKRAYLVRKNP